MLGLWLRCLSGGTNELQDFRKTLTLLEIDETDLICLFAAGLWQSACSLISKCAHVPIHFNSDGDI